MRPFLYFVAGIIIVVGCWILVRQHKEARVEQQVADIEKAITNAKSFHSKMIAYNQIYRQYIQETWVFCPGDRLETVATSEGLSVEKLWYEGHIYSRSKGSIGNWSPWYFSRTEAGDNVPGCAASSVNNPFDLKVGFDDMRRAEIKIDPAVRHINGEACSEYNFKAHSGRDFAYTFDQTLCINPDDHLPREVRADSVSYGDVKKITFDQWNTLSKPNVPEGFDSTEALR